LRGAIAALSADYQVLVLSGAGSNSASATPNDNVDLMCRGMQTSSTHHVVLGVNASDFGCADRADLPSFDWGPRAPADRSPAILDAIATLLEGPDRHDVSDDDDADESETLRGRSATAAAAGHDAPELNSGAAGSGTAASQQSPNQGTSGAGTESAQAEEPSSIMRRPLDYDELGAHRWDPQSDNTYVYYTARLHAMSLSRTAIPRATIVDPPEFANNQLANLQKQLANHYSWCKGWQMDSLEKKRDRASKGHLPAAAAYKAPGPYKFDTMFVNGPSAEAAAALLRTDVILDPDLREWVTMMSALSAYGLWKLQLQPTFENPRNPWSNADNRFTETITSTLLEGLAVLYGAETVRLIPLGDSSDEMKSSSHLVLPIAACRVQERWTVSMFSYIYAHNPELLTPEQRTIAQTLTAAGGLHGGKRALVAASRRREGSDSPGALGRAGYGSTETTRGAPKASPEVARPPTAPQYPQPSTMLRHHRPPAAAAAHVAQGPKQ